MTTQSHLPGLRPALSGLPPTLQPHAVLAYAPPTDRRRSAALSAGVYALLAGGVIWLAQAAPAGPKVQPLPKSDPVYIGPLRPAPQPPAARPPVAHPVDTPPVDVPPPPVVDQIPETPTELPRTNLSNDPPAPPQGFEGPTGEASTDSGPISVSSDSVRVLHQVSPAYPPLAIATRRQGDVVVRMVIDSSGVPISAEAVSGPQVFFGPAVAAARQWRFSPAIQNGQAVPATFLLTLKFILR